MNPKTIQAIRHALGETTDAFGDRWLRSSRTVENWEQGRRTPDAYIVRDLEKLADKLIRQGKLDAE